jgi:hypothetical protein
MKTKSSSRPSKKKTTRPTTASVRGRAAKTTSARPKLKSASPKKATAAKAKKPVTPPRAKATAAAVEGSKYRQSGAPWWKAFL